MLQTFDLSEVFTPYKIRVWGGGDPFGETLNQLKAPPIPEVSFYIQDHLGNTRILYHTTFTDCNQAAVLYHLEHVADYYPFGKILREYVAQGIPEKFLTTQHERDVRVFPPMLMWQIIL